MRNGLNETLLRIVTELGWRHRLGTCYPAWKCCLIECGSLLTSDGLSLSKLRPASPLQICKEVVAPCTLFIPDVNYIRYIRGHSGRVPISKKVTSLSLSVRLASLPRRDVEPLSHHDRMLALFLM